MRKTPKRIGLAIVGAGRVGLFRGEVAARHPMVDFIVFSITSLCESSTSSAPSVPTISIQVVEKLG